MNKETIITAVASAIAFIILCINTFAGTNIQVPADVITSVATLLVVAGMWIISHYFNQDYSEVARAITPIMRKVKILVKNGDRRLLEQIIQLAKEWDEENGEDFMEDDNYDD